MPLFGVQKHRLPQKSLLPPFLPHLPLGSWLKEFSLGFFPLRLILGPGSLKASGCLSKGCFPRSSHLHPHFVPPSFPRPWSCSSLCLAVGGALHTAPEGAITQVASG